MSKYLFLITLLLVGCSSTASTPTQSDQLSGELTVFAASSLTDAFNEMISEFQAEHPDVTITPNYGSSSQLATQINEGAPADVFASANQAQMDVIEQAGRLDNNRPIFATNRLVLIVPADNQAGIVDLADLGKPGIRLVLAVAGVPVRDYTDQMVEKYAPNAAEGFAMTFYANLVSEEENVRQVAAKVALGEADAAIVYTSDVTPDLDVIAIEIPDEYNVIATYPIGRIADSENPDLADEFINFVLNEEGQAILARWGFGSADGE